MRGISIIIPAYNEEDNIRACLKSMMELDHPLFEVLVADGGSKDKTREIIKNEFPKVRLIDNPAKYTSAGRNRAIVKAMYDLIAFTDADCIVPKDWLRVLVKGLEETHAVGVGGANFAPKDSPPFVQAISKAHRTFIGNLGSVQGKVFETAQEVDSIATCNALYEQRILLELRGFSEEHKDLGEDWELNYRLRQAGHKLMVVPGSFVWHNFRATPRKFFSNMYRYGMGRAILMKKYPEAIKPIYFAPIAFLTGMLLIIPFIPYIAILSAVALNIDRKLWKEITKVFVLQHFGYGIGEVFGLLFDDKVRL